MAKFHYKQHLPALFEKIEDGKPVHYKRFLLGLAETGISPNEVDFIFYVENIGKKRYRVAIDREHFDAYKQLKKKVFGNDYIPSPRVLAAAAGSSHSKSTSGAFGLIHTQQHKTSPFCFILENGIPRELPPLKKKLLLIENFELFLQYERVLNFIQNKTQTNEKINLTKYDIMYAAGGMVLSKQFKPFLMNYREIKCLFDLDFGGLIIYSTLKKSFKRTEFIVPDDFEGFITRYGFPMKDDEVKMLRGLGASTNMPKEIRRLMRQLSKMKMRVEQEVYLLES